MDTHTASHVHEAKFLVYEYKDKQYNDQRWGGMYLKKIKKLDIQNEL